MPVYISASRRTDIPRFYADEFFNAWHCGRITYNGGYGRSWTVSLENKDVMGYILWSKDFRPFISHPSFNDFFSKNNSVFHYTINDCPELEPGVSDLSERLCTLKSLCEIVGAERVFWRFDPICKYMGRNGNIKSNESSFFRILPSVAVAGITRCYFSFMTSYNNMNTRRTKFIDFTVDEKIAISLELLSACNSAGMQLYNCCNADIIKHIPGIKKASCIDNNVLEKTDRFGVHTKLKLKPTRRECGCYESRDIGSYNDKCFHRCAYCYANHDK
jgi:hypothetical protein